MMAGIFEETARFLVFIFILKVAVKKSDINTGLSYGVGHGGIEAILLAGLTAISNIIFSLTYNAGVLPITPEVVEPINQLLTMQPVIFLVSGLERMLAIAIQISLSVIVYLGVRYRKYWLYPIAILLHALIDVPAAMTQRGALSIAACEGIIAVLTIILCFAAYQLYKNISKKEAIREEITQEESPQIDNT
jgi:uncharacterized membrane protein YhfC